MLVVAVVVLRMGLSIVARVTDACFLLRMVGVVCVVASVVVVVGVGTDSSKVTRCWLILVGAGMLFSIASIFSSASSWAAPFWFLWPLIAWVRSSIAFVRVSVGVSVGWVM